MSFKLAKAYTRRMVKAEDRPRTKRTTGDPAKIITLDCGHRIVVYAAEIRKKKVISEWRCNDCARIVRSLRADIWRDNHSMPYRYRYRINTSGRATPIRLTGSFDPTRALVALHEDLIGLSPEEIYDRVSDYIHNQQRGGHHAHRA